MGKTMKIISTIFLTMIFSIAVLVIPAQADQIKGYTLGWDANSEPDMAGYKIYVGTASRDYGTPIIPTGPEALATQYDGSLTIPEDVVITYYWAVTAYDTAGLESDYSNEVFKEFDTNEDPVITLTGANPQNIERGNPYTELGATVTDNSGDISSSLVIDASTVNTNTLGTYVVTYNVTDAAGNTAIEETRSVIVEDNTPPAPPTGLTWWERLIAWFKGLFGKNTSNTITIG